MNRDTYRIGLSDEIPKPSRHGRLQVGEVSPEGPDPSVRLHELKKGYKVQMFLWESECRVFTWRLGSVPVVSCFYCQ